MIEGNDSQFQTDQIFVAFPPANDGITIVVDQDFSPTPPLFTATLSLTGVFAESFTVGIRGLLTGADLLAFDGTPGFGADI